MNKADKNELVRKLGGREGVAVTFKRMNDRAMGMLNALLVKGLTMMDSLFMLNSLITVVRELVENAQKANAKRILFAKLGRDIGDEAQYRAVMAEYSDKMKHITRHMEGEIDAGGYDVTVRLRFDGDDFLVEVSNNALILDGELDRIRLRLERGRAAEHFMDIFGEIQDTTEGGGVGLVLAIFMLRNMGVDPGNLTVGVEEGQTRMRLRIPGNLKPAEVTTEVKRQILGDVKGLPTFPETIENLLGLCDDPKSSMEDIAEAIERDPALTTDVVRLSNSAGFISGKRIYNAIDAVKTIGLKNVRALLMVSSARSILDSRYEKFEEIWEHCNRVSLYSRFISHDYQLTGRFENIATAGLLHDLGMIVLLSTDMELMQRIASIVHDRGIINSTVLEEVSIGISHSALGGVIARRWNFPDYLIEAIQHHHSPLGASAEFRDIVFTVYLANMLVGIEERKFEYPYIEETVLERFSLSGDRRLEAYHGRLMEQARDSK
jgi:HD-like signal output (HDOD) protein